MKTNILIAGISLFFFTCTFAQKSDYSFKESFTLNSPASIKASLSDGFIKVFSSESDKTDVYFIVTKGNSLQKITKEELDPFVQVIITHDPNDLEITIKHRNKNNWKNNYNISCEIYTPNATSCDLRTSDGDIKIKGLTGDQKCRTSDGDVFVSDITGQLNCITSDGDVQAYNIAGNINLETSDGDVKAENVEGETEFITSDGDVSLFNITGTIYARTSDGDISFTGCSGSVDAQTSDGDIEGKLNKLKHKLSLLTSDGDINATIPDGLSFNLKLKGSDLDVSLTDFSGKTEEYLIEGSVRGGGIPVELLASDGRVSLTYK
jgi:hypothetical protein